MQIDLIVLMLVVASAYADKDLIHLTFEVENQDEFCLYQKFNESIEYEVEFGVVKGGNFDIDFTLESPSKKLLYEGKRVSKKDTCKFESTTQGDFKFCFSNNFSPVTHKVVYFSLRPYGEKYRNSLRKEAGQNVPMVLSAAEHRLNNIHTRMENVSSIQRFYRIEELVDRNFADMLNDKIYVLSLSNSITIFLVSIAQVCILKWLFNKKPSLASDHHHKALIPKQHIKF